MSDDVKIPPQLPPGWREMDYRIWLKLEEIELRLRMLWDQDKFNRGMFESNHEFQSIVSERLEGFGEDMLKLHDVYYKVFPERAKQDWAFSQQMKSLLSKRDKGGDPKNS